MVLWRRELDFRKIKVWDLKMLLMVFWNSLGLIWGALGTSLGGLLVLLRAFGGNLTSQDDPPTFENLSFVTAGTRLSKKQGLGSKDALDDVLELSWVHFGCSWGLLGDPFGAFAGFRWHLEFS